MTPFAPGNTVKITVAAASGRVALQERRGPFQVRVCNLGTATAWIKFGDGTVAATTSDLPIPGNGFTEVITVNPDTATPYVAAIAAAATGDIAFTLGGGF